MPEQPQQSEGLKGLDGLANLIKHFIVRDLIYAIGGGLLLVSVVYACGMLDVELRALAGVLSIVSLLVVGAAWAVGYAVSDGLGGIVPGLLQPPKRMPHMFEPRGQLRWWPFVRPDYIHKPQRFPQRLFESFAQQPWENDPTISVDEFRFVAAELINQEFGSYHRNVLLRHLGTAIGSCGLLASIIGGVGAHRYPSAIGWPFCIGGILVSCLLLMIGWVKALQQTHDINREVLRRRAELAVSPVRY